MIIMILIKKNSFITATINKEDSSPHNRITGEIPMYCFLEPNINGLEFLCFGFYVRCDCELDIL